MAMLKWQSLCQNDFSCSKLLYTHVQYVFNKSAKNQNVSAKNITLSQVDFTIKVLFQMHHLNNSSQSIQNPVEKNNQNKIAEKSCHFDENNFISIILLPAPIQYVCNESSKYRFASTYNLR